MEERNYKLYVHISPSNKRYYGITGRENCEYRWNNGKGYLHNKHFTNSINKYGWDNFEHIVLFNNLTKEEASLLEQMYIALYNTFDDDYGYNQSLGGENNVCSEKTKKKLSEANKGENNPNYGKPRSEQTKKKISEANKGENNGMYGKQHTEQTKKKLSQANKGENNPTSKPILMFTFKGEFIRRFDSTGEANVYLGKCRSSDNIGNCARVNAKGEYKTAWGYIWIYEEDYIEHNLSQRILNLCYTNQFRGLKMGKNNPISKPILMFTKDGEFIRRFDCVADANEYLGKKRSYTNISRCAASTNGTAYGYKWIYEEDYIKEQEEQQAI